MGHFEKKINEKNNNILSKIEEDSLEYILHNTDDDSTSNVSEKAEEELLKKLEEKTQMKKKQKNNNRRKTRSSRWVNTIGYKKKNEESGEEEEIIKEEEGEEDEDEKEEEKVKEKEKEGNPEIDDENRSKEADWKDEIKMKLIPVEITSKYIPKRSSSNDKVKEIAFKTSRSGSKVCNESGNMMFEKHKKIKELSEKLEEIKKSTLNIKNQMDIYMKTKQPRPGFKGSYASPEKGNEETRDFRREFLSVTAKLKGYPSSSNTDRNLYTTPKLEENQDNGENIEKSKKRLLDKFSLFSKKNQNRTLFSTMASTNSDANFGKKKHIFDSISIIPSKPKKSCTVFKSHENVNLKKKPLNQKTKLEKYSIKKIIEHLSPKNSNHISYWDSKTSPKKIRRKSQDPCKINFSVTAHKTSQNLKKNKEDYQEIDKFKTMANYFETSGKKNTFKSKSRRKKSKKKSEKDQSRFSHLNSNKSGVFDLSYFETVGDYGKYKLSRGTSNHSLPKKDRVRSSYFDERKKRLRIKKIDKSGYHETTNSIINSDIKSKEGDNNIYRNLVKEFLDTSTKTNTIVNKSTDLSERVVNLLPEKLIERIKNRKYYDKNAIKEHQAGHLQPTLHAMLRNRSKEVVRMKSKSKSIKRYSDKKRRHTSLNNEVNIFELFNGKHNYRPSFQNGQESQYYSLKSAKTRTNSVLDKKVRKNS